MYCLCANLREDLLANIYLDKFLYFYVRFLDRLDSKFKKNIIKKIDIINFKNMNNENYKLRLSINSVEVEVCGDKDFVERNFANLKSEFLEKEDKESIARNNLTDLIEKNVSLRDFVNSKKPKDKATELMPVLVYYAKHYENTEQFNEDDIKSLYRRYDISKRPKNIYQAIIDISRNKGYFESVSKSSGYFKITESGEHFVEVKLEIKE
jgi:hypothetical protein